MPFWFSSYLVIACVARVPVRIRSFYAFWPRENWGERKQEENGGGVRKERLQAKPAIVHERGFQLVRRGILIDRFDK